ncbi:MAG TPA: efflux RND transporter permease subunit, partial [Candidatus Cloacimonadota bacterium]|nr:efflux RND transporter permease subunit [Candidatus Cloacimonadota bacterium]
MKSESMESYSVIKVEFDWGSNLDAATQDMRDMIDQTLSYLPASVSRPMVMKFDTSQIPILIYGASGMANTYELQKVMKDDVSNRLKKLDGVASVRIMGGDELEVQINIDRSKIEQYQLSFEQIQQAIGLQNINISGGHIEQYKNDYLIRTLAEFKSIEELADSPIKFNADGSVLRLKDIAEVKKDFKERRYELRTNKLPTATFMILKESGKNTLTVVKNAKKELEAIEKSGQYDLKFYEINDMGKIIEGTTNDATSNVIFGSILAILIMYVFMRNWRPTLAISLAIPLSVIATFIPIYLMKFSLNLMTLGGLALGVGMLVDNAVVVIENIYRHVELGHDKMKSASIGAKEVAMAITASTLTTTAVFLPMVFSNGMTAILVKGLALTVAFSLFVSLVVALTIVPVMASIFFQRDSKMIGNTSWFDKVRDPYIRLLKAALNHRIMVILIIIAAIIVSIGLMFTLGAEF